MEARLHVPDVLRHVGLDAALSGLQRLAEAELSSMGRWPALYRTNVRYQREPQGEERWLPPSEVLRRGHADCEDLAAYRAAELTLTGEDPGAEARVVRTGPRTWHAVVLRSDGSWEDPSAAMGMQLASGIHAPVRFRLRPEGTRDYRARVDVSGLGAREAVECVGCSPADAFGGAALGALETEVGVLPFIAPFLNIASQAAQRALPAPTPPGAPRPPTPPTVVVAPPAGPGGAYSGLSFEGGILHLASQLSQLAEREARRRGAAQQAKLQQAIRR